MTELAARRVPRRRRRRTPRGPKVVVDNRSGKWSQPSRALLTGLESSTDDRVPHAVLMTEVTEPHQAAAIKRVPGYMALHDLTYGDRDEVAVLLDRRRVEPLSWSTYVLGPDLGPGGRVVGGVATARLLDVNRNAVFAVWHSPASVEGDWDGFRAKVWRASYAELRERVREARARVGGMAPVYVGGDFNLNFRREWVRVAVDREWPALRVPRLPRTGGTHAGGRYIDPVLVAGGVEGARMWHLPRVRGNDHRPQRCVSWLRTVDAR